MSRTVRCLALLIALLVPLLAAAAPARGAEPDRLERFRRLVADRLDAALTADSDGSTDAYRDAYALLDEEIVDNLGAGGVFASPAFLRERLEGFMEAWGGASLSLVTVDDVLVGAFQLGEDPAGSSVRVYGRLGGDAALLTTFHHSGRPAVHRLPGQAAQFLVTWAGASTGRGTNALRVDLVRRLGDDIRVVWSTADVFATPLTARSWSVHGSELRVRYEVRYPGWAPGCEPQTEVEDVYRLTPAGSVERKSRHEYEAWHRELHRAAAHLFAALADGDQSAIARMVPEAKLRAKLPRSLHAEPACDAADGAGHSAVSIAAIAGEAEPWVLTFHRAGSQWRLTGASPVLQ